VSSAAAWGRGSSDSLVLVKKFPKIIAFPGCNRCFVAKGWT